MTGYGRAEVEFGDALAVVEIRSVNHRYADVVTRFARDLYGFEEDVRTLVGEYCRRGRVEVFATLAAPGTVPAREYAVNQALLATALSLLRQVTDNGGLDVELPRASDLLLLPGLFIERTWSAPVKDQERAILAATRVALEHWQTMRRREGANLTAHLVARLADLSALCEQLILGVPIQEHAARERLQRRLDEVLSDRSVDAERMAVEMAIMNQRSSVEEELHRLKSHCSQASGILEEQDGTGAGKRLEFLIQEMAREVNTIGAKSADLTVTEQVLSAKHILEQMREQVQNVE